MDPVNDGIQAEGAECGVPGACTVSGLARWAGVSRTTVQAWMRCPDFPRDPDGSINPWKVCDWHRARQKAQQPATTPFTDDPMLLPTPGSKSKALEKYRRARADLANLDLEERRGSLIARDKAHDGLMDIARLIRQAGDALRRQFGPEAYALLDGALNQAEARINGLCGPLDGSDAQPGLPAV